MTKFEIYIEKNNQNVSKKCNTVLFFCFISHQGKNDFRNRVPIDN